jgi:hypothetical protein
MPDVRRPTDPHTSPHVPELPKINAQGYRPGGPAPGSSCFPRGTKIDTPKGPTDIANIAVGDLVFSFCERQQRIQERRVIKAIAHRESSIWTLELADGHVIRTTRMHSFRTELGWRRADHIQTGMKIMLSTSQMAIVISSRESQEIAAVYNLIVEGEFTYLASGTVAHSFTHLRRLRMLAWSVAVKLRDHFSPVWSTRANSRPA